MDRLLTTAEAAEYLRKPVGTLRYWRHVGIGPRCARLGRTVVYRERDVLAYVDEQFENEDRVPAA